MFLITSNFWGELARYKKHTMVLICWLPQKGTHDTWKVHPFCQRRFLFLERIIWESWLVLRGVFQGFSWSNSSNPPPKKRKGTQKMEDKGWEWKNKFLEGSGQGRGKELPCRGTNCNILLWKGTNIDSKSPFARDMLVSGSVLRKTPFSRLLQYILGLSP